MTEPSAEVAAPAPSGPASGAIKPRGAFAYLAIVLFVVPAALVFLVMGDCSSAKGTLVVKREAAVGDGFTLHFTRCKSLQPLGRVGARVLTKGDRGGGLVVVADPIGGPHLYLIEPGSCRDGAGDCRLIEVPAGRCQERRARIEPNGNVYNHVPAQRGLVKLRCTLEDGTQVEGKVSFDDC